MEDLKKILIVDDSEIDREVLKSILDDEFELIEADNGYSALDIVLEKKQHVDAVLLDVSMPFLNGLSVLLILREHNLDDVALFMITAEATKDNIEKASQYNIAEFIRKPFDREDILNRVRTKFGVEPKMNLTKADMEETRKYISDLERIYERYLLLSGKNKAVDERRVHLMGILLERHSIAGKKMEAGSFLVEMLCKSAYLCNIGNMLLQNAAGDETNKALLQQHTVLGAEIVRLNYSKHCRRFVKIYTDMCLYHHERYDGCGYPNGIGGKNIPLYAQLCGLLERFDTLFFPYSRHNELQFDNVVGRLKEDIGFVSDEALSLLEGSKADIIKYYGKHYI